MSILYTFNDNKDESTENPAGTKGFAFVEFAAPTEGLRTYIKTTFLRLGFQCIAKHKQFQTKPTSPSRFPPPFETKPTSSS